MKDQEEITTYLKELKGKYLNTLGQNRRFRVNGIQWNLILITTSTGTPRNVPLQGTIDAYNHIMNYGTLTRAEIRDKKYSDWNPTYIAAILASFPEIEHTTNPITLHKKQIN